MFQNAIKPVDDLALQDLHRALAMWNRKRLVPSVPTPAWLSDLDEERAMKEVEGTWVESLRASVQASAASVPRDVSGFCEWFRSLKQQGPGQNDPLFAWLAGTASHEQMNWFLTQEAAGEAGFEDLVAFAQIKIPVDEAKLELARNYWDEMGQGKSKGMHGPMLSRAVESLQLNPTIEGTVWQSLALANTLTAFATTRRYAWHALGALGVVELTAPTRVELVAEGLKRLNHPRIVRKYFDLHATLDIRHAQDWIANVFCPLIADNADCVPYLAEGALMRLVCGARCFATYRSHLWR